MKLNNQFFINIGISVIVIAGLIGIVSLMLAQMGIQIQEASQIYEYSPFYNFNLVSVIIAFGTALVLTFLIAFLVPKLTNETEIPQEEKTLFLEKK